MLDLDAWAQRHGITPQARAELVALLDVVPDPPAAPSAKSEAATQASVRLCAPVYGGVLWRNNVGAFVGEDGVPIRFGLANDSRRVNKRVKSSDLIGVFPFLVGPEHIGKTVGIFTAIECKRAAWTWGGSDREKAQRKFHNIVRVAGGVAGFARSREEFMAILGGA